MIPVLREKTKSGCALTVPHVFLSRVPLVLGTGALVVLGILLPVVGREVPEGGSAIICWTGFLLWLGWWSCSFFGVKHTRFLRHVFVVSFFLRVIAGGLLVYFGYWTDDGHKYHTQSQELLRSSHSQTIVEILSNYHPYSLLCWWIYHIVGPSTVGARTLNAWMGSIVPVFTFFIARRAGTARSAVTAAWLVALFPDFILYSGLQLKDLAVTLGVTCSLWMLMELEFGALTIWKGICGGVLVGVAILLRPLVVVAGGTGLLWVLLWKRKAVAKIVLGTALPLFLADFLVVFFYEPSWSLTGWFLGKASVFHSSLWPLETKGGASFFDVFTGAYHPLLILVGIGYTLLVPFLLWPFTVDDVFYRLLGPGTVLWYALLPFFLRGAGRHGYPGAGLLRVFVLTILCGLALGGGFAGAGRFKMMAMPALLICTAWGLEDFRRGDRWAHGILCAYLVMAVVGIGYYLWYKG